MKHTIYLIIGLALNSSLSAATTEQQVLNHYAVLAHSMYSDSLITATSLSEAIDKLITNPTEANLGAAKEAWISARHPYQQTEVYRFGNAIVDEWEGKVNAWPLDEGLIDYVDASYGDESDENPYYTANIIANPILKLSGRVIDTTNITKEILSAQLHEIDEVEANVATGYHAIEFLLWGQDLNGTGPGAGNRPVTDYDVKNCTMGNCDRRAAYLKAVTELLVDDLSWMVEQWSTSGTARKAITEGVLKENLATIFTGMGSLSYGELAGERMKLGLILHDPEEEHDCFSDNTHWSHFNDVKGILNVYTGHYTRIDGTIIKGPSLSDLVTEKSPATDSALRAHLLKTLGKMKLLVESANQGIAYDQLIGENNPKGNASVQAVIDALIAQTHLIEKAVTVLDLGSIAFEGSESLDEPHKVK
ncbi:MAG: imelysin family protein [Candidatus Thiodiazotropha sp. 6PLUC4]